MVLNKKKSHEKPFHRRDTARKWVDSIWTTNNLDPKLGIWIKYALQRFFNFPRRILSILHYGAKKIQTSEKMSEKRLKHVWKRVFRRKMSEKRLNSKKMSEFF